MSSSESTLQQTAVKMIRTFYPSLVLNLSLNGISLDGLSATQRAQLIRQAKLEGMETGIQDLTIYLPDSQVLNLEFKRPNGGTQSPDQKRIESKLISLGHNYELVRSAKEVFALIAEYTDPGFRRRQSTTLTIPVKDDFLSESFMHWPKGTSIHVVNQQLKELYHII